MTGVLLLVGLPLAALNDGTSGAAGAVALLCLGAATIGLLVWIIATGVAMGMREVRDEREPDLHR